MVGFKRKRYGKLAILGPYPPPFGGISIHVQRMLAILEKKNVRFDFFNMTKGSLYKKHHYRFYYGNPIETVANTISSMIILLLRRYRVIHIHNAYSLFHRIVAGILGLFNKPVYLHVHNVSINDAIKRGGMKGWLLKKLLRNVNILAVNREIERGARDYTRRKVIRIDAFLPPSYDEKLFERFKKSYNIDRDEYDLIISMVGWFTEYNNEDLYGYDLTAKTVRYLKKKGYKVLVIAGVNGILSKRVHEAFKKALESYNIGENFLMIYGDLGEIWPIYLISHVFIRPTNTDGSPLSIKEAIWVGTPVIASDCVDRIENVRLFPNRDYLALARCLEDFIKNKDKLKTIDEKIKMFNARRFTNRLLTEVYKIG
ncbi:MAG: glycosyltransferase family 4 protein [Promethearchaeota archaeon]